MSAEDHILESDNESASAQPHYDAFVSYATNPDRDLVRDVVDYIVQETAEGTLRPHIDPSIYHYINPGLSGEAESKPM